MDMFFLKENKNGKFEWYVETQNNIIKKKIDKKLNSQKKSLDSIEKFKQILSLENVDKTRTLSNNIWDLYYTLGIEAVRQYLIESFTEIMKGINMCHILMLVDKMTHNGTLSSMSRYTMRTENGVLNKVSFEETLSHLTDAGLYGTDEKINGVSASIVCGKRGRYGTGLCDLVMDIQKLC
jgi:DNA-directed RNA polymerase beta' subunit